MNEVLCYCLLDLKAVGAVVLVYFSPGNKELRDLNLEPETYFLKVVMVKLEFVQKLVPFDKVVIAFLEILEKPLDRLLQDEPHLLFVPPPQLCYFVDSVLIIECELFRKDLGQPQLVVLRKKGHSDEVCLLFIEDDNQELVDPLGDFLSGFRNISLPLLLLRVLGTFRVVANNGQVRFV